MFDLTVIGEKFGHLTITGSTEEDEQEDVEYNTSMIRGFYYKESSLRYFLQNRLWRCKCDCGKIVLVCGESLLEARRRKHTSCGCVERKQRKRFALADAIRNFAAVAKIKQSLVPCEVAECYGLHRKLQKIIRIASK